MKKSKLAIIGARGRMGQAIKRLAVSEFSANLEISTEITTDSSADDLKSLLKADVILDVSLPEACASYLSQVLVDQPSGNLPALVVGSTGWNEKQTEVLRAYSARAAVLVAPNFSPSVNLFLHMLETYSPYFKEWGYESALFESHHNKKKDAPSGTAKALLQKLENAGHSPQVSHVRAGNIVGTHVVSFIGPEDIFEIRHEALNRDLFARGAVIAATWMAQPGRVPGQSYSMRDVFFSK